MIKHFTDPKELKTIDVVIQTGGRNAKVKAHLTGLESFLTMYVWTHLTPKGAAHVFDHETKAWLGFFYLDENGTIRRKEADDTTLTFDDFYTQAQ